MDKFYVPLSILVAGVAVAGALFYTQIPAPSSNAVRVESDPKDERNEITPERTLTLINPRRSENRHVLGSEKAKVTIVEFSDYECPFCARVHPTLERIVEESQGDVAWEFRHLPLSIHRNAESAALAAECVAELGDNDAFWEFSDYLFANQSSLSDSIYKTGASSVGVSESDFAACLLRSDIAKWVDEDSQAAAALGGGGTPFSVIIYEDGSTRAVAGALPYEQFKALVQR